MKKKICIIAVLLVAMVGMLVGCHKVVLTTYEEATKAYANIGNAKSITKTVSVTYGDMKLAETEEIYISTSDGYTVTTNTFAVNGIGQENTQTTTTNTVGKNEVSFGVLFKESDLTDVVASIQEEIKTVTAKVATQALEKISLSEADVQGDVNVKMFARENYFDKMTLTYKTANGNDVQISFVYAY